MEYKFVCFFSLRNTHVHVLASDTIHHRIMQIVMTVKNTEQTLILVRLTGASVTLWARAHQLGVRGAKARVLRFDIDE